MTPVTTPLDDLLTYPEAARALHVSLSTLRRWIERGEMASTRIRGRVYIHRAEMDRCVARAVDAGRQRQRRRAKAYDALRRAV